MSADIEVLDPAEAGVAVGVIARAAAGDANAFASIVARYHDDLSRVGFAVAGDRELGRDAVQAAWETAWRKLPSLREPAKLRGWLLVIVANEARRLQRRRRLGTILEFRAEFPAPPHGMEGIEVSLDLARAIALLKPRDRQILALRFSVGLTSEEISQIVGLTPSSVRSQLSRLADRLRKELSDD